MKIIVGYDKAIKEMVKGAITIIKEHGYDVTDLGADQPIDDFTTSSEMVAKGIQRGDYQRGVLFCGSGIGVCISANKFSGIRAALAYDALPAALSVIDNNANVLCTGAWLTQSDEKCAKMIETWLMVQYNNRDGKGMMRLQEVEKSRISEES